MWNNIITWSLCKKVQVVFAHVIPSPHRIPLERAGYVPLLSTYVPFNITQFENLAVTPGGKRMYLVRNGSVHLFPNFDTMTAMNISLKNVIFMGNWTEFSSIPEVRDNVLSNNSHDPLKNGYSLDTGGAISSAGSVADNGTRRRDTLFLCSCHVRVLSEPDRTFSSTCFDLM